MIWYKSAVQGVRNFARYTFSGVEQLVGIFKKKIQTNQKPLY